MNEDLRHGSKKELGHLQAPITSCHIQFGLFLFIFWAPSPAFSAKYSRILRKHLNYLKKFKLKSCDSSGCPFLSFPPLSPSDEAASCVD